MDYLFHSQRLSFRPYDERDIDALVSLYNDWQWADVNEAFAKDFLTQVIQKQYAYGAGVWATFLKENHIYIGHCGLKFMPDKQEWYLSFRFLKTYWRNEIPLEALSACIRWGFGQLQITEIVVDLEEQNQGAAKILLRAGFKVRFAYAENNQQLIRYSIFSN